MMSSKVWVESSVQPVEMAGRWPLVSGSRVFLTNGVVGPNSADFSGFTRF